MWEISFPGLCYFIWQKRFLQWSWRSIINLRLPSIRKNARNLPVNHILAYQSVQPLSRVWLFATPSTVAHQASLSITNTRNLLKLMSIESVMPSNHLILCRPLLLLPSIFLSIRVFSNESALCIRWPNYWSFSFSISPSNEYSGLISFRKSFSQCSSSNHRGPEIHRAFSGRRGEWRLESLELKKSLTHCCWLEDGGGHVPKNTDSN